MLLEHLGWGEAAAPSSTRPCPAPFGGRLATYDLARLLPGPPGSLCSAFGEQLVKHMG